MTNNCKVACKKCTIPVHAPTKRPKATLSPSPASLLSKAAASVQQGASNVSEAAGNMIGTGKEAAANLLANVTSVKDSVTGAITTDSSSRTQNQSSNSVLGKTALAAVVVADEVKQALAAAANISRGDTADDAPGAANRKKYDDSQVRNTSACFAYEKAIPRQIVIRQHFLRCASGRWYLTPDSLLTLQYCGHGLAVHNSGSQPR